MSSVTRRTAVVLTALGLEYAAVKEHLGGSIKEREERGTLYEIGTFVGRRATWTVAITETGEGNATAGVQLERAVQVFSPEVILFVGVAGGRKDVRLGDVVAADAVYDYEAGKDTESQYLPRIKTAAPSYGLVQRARAVARNVRWLNRIKPGPPEQSPSALVKPIAAGGKIVAHDRSRTARLLAQACGDAVAVDMESAGFLHGAYTNAQVSALVVRGISDLLTGKNERADREWQPIAARHAAAFAFELLDNLSPVQDSGTRSKARLRASVPLVLLRPPYQALPTGLDLRAQPSVLLQARFGVVPFIGRERSLGGLFTWCTGDDQPFKIRVITGPGGAGKSRLASELCAQLAKEGWQAGFIPPAALNSTQTASPTWPSLLVVDYAAGEVSRVAQLASQVLYRASGPPARILLLARNKGSWWTTLLGLEPLVENVAAEDLQLGAEPLTPDDRRKHYELATWAFSTRFNRGALPLSPPDLNESAFQFPLLVHIRALLDVLGDDPPPTTRDGLATSQALLEALLRREAKYWAVTFDRYALKLSGPLQRRVVALMSLAGADKRAELTRLLRAVDDLRDAEAERVGQIADALHDLYPGVPYLDQVQPDLLTERLVASDLSEVQELIQAFDQVTSDAQAARMLALLIRAASNEVAGDRSRIAGSLRELLERRLGTLVDRAIRAAGSGPNASRQLPVVLAEALRLCSLRYASAEVLWRIPVEAVGLADLALALAEQVVVHYRRLAEAEPGTHLPNLAMSLSNLAVRYSSAGRLKDAIAPVKEAVSIRRGLADADPDAYLPQLATSVRNLAGRLGQAGRLEDALILDEEAVELYRRLADVNPNVYLSDYAMALNNLAVTLGDIGRDEDGLQPANEAVELYRRLAQDGAEKHVAAVTVALNTLANRLAGARQLEDALVPATEAVELRRRLARANPSFYQPVLASALENLANTLGELGRTDEALGFGKEAVDLFRRVTEADPDAYLPEFAASLSNHAVWLARAGRGEEALGLARGAVAVRRRLAEANPDVYLHDLAKSLDNLVGRLEELGRREDALVAAEEAAAAHRRLAEANLDVHMVTLVGSLNGLANRLRDVGRREEALDVAKEAVAVLRRLVADSTEGDPGAHVPGLATALHNLSVELAAAGRNTEALGLAEEAVGLFRQLAHTNPSASLPNLATSLNTLANRLTAGGHHLNALAPAKEAVDLCRQLADSDPRTYLPDLAMALHTLATGFGNVARYEEAIGLAKEAVELHRDLAKTYPEVYLTRLTGSLEVLANQLTDVGRGDEAKDIRDAARSVRLLRFEWLVRLTVAAVQGDLEAQLALRSRITEIAARDEWAGLAAALSRISDGERAGDISFGLDSIDSEIVSEILRRLTTACESSMLP